MDDAQPGPPLAGRSLDLLLQSDLTPFLPLIYLAWSDGRLSTDEIRHIRTVAVRRFGNRGEVQASLSAWLDPENPPSATELLRLLHRIRRSAPSHAHCRQLAWVDLALAIKGEAGKAGDEYWQREEHRRALGEVYAALDLPSRDALYYLLPWEDQCRDAPVGLDETEPRFEVGQMQGALEGPHRDRRARIRRMLEGSGFAFHYELPKERHRELVLQWLRQLAQDGVGRLAYPALFDETADLAPFIAVFETLAFFDLSLVVKFGVQFGLFGGSIYFLGNEAQRREYLPAVASGELLGCFAMTERDHGSNVRDLQTRADFDLEGDAWIIHTPGDGARKDWIGGAAVHARLATVFAQLRVGDSCHGVHAFLVPIRDEGGNPLPGIHVEDCGHKMGLNGVDNGRLWFERVCVPRANLLGRFATVGSDGSYASPIPSDNRRFFTMLSTLVGGRVAVAGAAISVAKTALTIAVRYGLMRRQFGPPGEPETRLLDYPSHQRRLMPRLAATYALNFAQLELTALFTAAAESDGRELETFAAALKAYSSEHAVTTAQTCRECCGGQGYLSVNRIPHLKADSDVFTTFEGDNTVLRQLVARGLLTEYKRQFEDMHLLGALKWVAERTAAAFVTIRSSSLDEDYLGNPDHIANALGYRRERVLTTLARRFRKRMKAGLEPFEAARQCQNHMLALADAYAQERVFAAAYRTAAAHKDNGLGPPLDLCCRLYGLSCLERHADWFLEHDYMTGDQSRRIRKLVTRLCAEMREQALPLVSAFGIPDHWLAAPIAFSDIFEDN